MCPTPCAPPAPRTPPFDSIACREACWCIPRSPVPIAGATMTTTRITATVLTTVVAVALVRALSGAASPEKARMVPAPAVDDKSGAATSQVAVLAGGCFWGVQGVYQHINGVTKAVSGYAGGEKNTAQYEYVGTGRTGHAESVQITFDPRVISYGKL